MLKEKCTKALDVIKVVANSKWGANKNYSSTSQSLFWPISAYL